MPEAFGEASPGGLFEEDDATGGRWVEMLDWPGIMR